MAFLKIAILIFFFASAFSWKLPERCQSVSVMNEKAVEIDVSANKNKFQAINDYTDLKFSSIPVDHDWNTPGNFSVDQLAFFLFSFNRINH